MTALSQTDLSTRFGDGVHSNRIMVIGQDVAMVQRLSRYCLDQGADVFPYYGTPTAEDIALFRPEVSIVCLPVAEDMLTHLNHPYIFWAEPQQESDQPANRNWSDLEKKLQEALKSKLT
jgi:hypothetical protein